MKRLRFSYLPKKIRYFHCGEYGEDYGRPHYHACLFGIAFPDRQYLKMSPSGYRIYTSATLEKYWTFGFSSLGNVTFESAAYVARYIMKKVTGDKAEKHYEALDPETGEIHKLKPEYTTMSRRPGIGADWYSKFKSEVYPSDEIILDAKRMRPPKFYDGRLELEDPQLHQRIKKLRLREAAKHKEDQTPERLAVRETVKLAQTTNLKRKIK